MPLFSEFISTPPVPEHVETAGQTPPFAAVTANFPRTGTPDSLPLRSGPGLASLITLLLVL